MKIQELIKDLEAMQDEGMEEVQVMTLDAQRLFPSVQQIDHVTLYRNELTVLLVAESASSADI